jgi:predicted nuclease of predicted toxin-antitoxin system
MRLLLDECVPARLRAALPAHDAVSSELPRLLPHGPALEVALARLAPRSDVLVSDQA